MKFHFHHRRFLTWLKVCWILWVWNMCIKWKYFFLHRNRSFCDVNFTLKIQRRRIKVDYFSISWTQFLHGFYCEIWQLMVDHQWLIENWSYFYTKKRQLSTFSWCEYWIKFIFGLKKKAGWDEEMSKEIKINCVKYPFFVNFSNRNSRQEKRLI